MGNDDQTRLVLFTIGLPIPLPSVAWRKIEYFANYLRTKGMLVYIAGAITPTLVLSKLRLLTCRKQGYRAKPSNYTILNVQPYIGLKLWLTSIFNVITSLFITVTIPLLKPEIVIVSIPEIEQVLPHI